MTDAKAAIVVAGAGSGLGALWSLAKEIAAEVLGVPLPVILAAATGAFWARATQPQATFAKALLSTVAWIVTASFLASFVQWAIGAAFSSQVPPQALAGIALLITWLGPMAAPIIKDGVEKGLRKRFDRLGGGE